MPTHYINESVYSYSEEVYEALRTAKPIVALESTVIAHGLPQPDNLEVARQCEKVVRDNGAVPATIAVLGGRILIGCGEDELYRLAYGDKVRKLSVRDIALAVSHGWDGATTVAATLHVADFLPVDVEAVLDGGLHAQPRIQVFATGGVGGVHRGWEKTLDISADLPLIERSSLVTVCAGAKQILDVPATLEWLETHGVPVLGWQTEMFPSFYSRSSGLKLDLRVESAAEVAAVVNGRWATGSNRGLLLTAPVPVEYEVPASEIEPALEKALADAEQRGVKGKELTPFLLSALRDATGGRSLSANRALLINNATIGAQVAVALAAADEALVDED